MRKKYIISIIVLIITGMYSFEQKNSFSLIKNDLRASSIPKNNIKKELHKIDALNNYSKVLQVIDGDTIVVFYNNSKEKIRLIGVNTPESVDPRKAVECFGKEASAFTRKLVERKKVLIVFDESQDARDKYGRILAYLYRDDGLFINKEIIEKGYGYEYTYKYPYKFQSEFKEAERIAEINKNGLWQDGICIFK